MSLPAGTPGPEGMPKVFAPTDTVGRGGPDAESRAWLTRLRGVAPVREAAIAELLALLLNAARFVLLRRRSQIASFPREDLDDLATEAAGEALLAVLARLEEYRGESRFTTWAWKFAFFEASEAIRRRSWMGRELPSEDAGWDLFARHGSPEAEFGQRELLAELKSGIDSVLTPHQRTVFVALALNGVPVDVLAERMGTTRGALYKTLHEARARLRAHLDATTGPPSRNWLPARAEWNA
jgi:RNA polymerase sigma-70 factor (ECF subfamily)